MKPTLCMFLAVLAAVAVRGDSVIQIRLSYKVIVSPVDASLPLGFSDSAVDRAIDEMNELMESYGRGYRFVRVEFIHRVGNIGGFDRQRQHRRHLRLS